MDTASLLAWTKPLVLVLPLAYAISIGVILRRELRLRRELKPPLEADERVSRAVFPEKYRKYVAENTARQVALRKRFRGFGFQFEGTASSLIGLHNINLQEDNDVAQEAEVFDNSNLPPDDPASYDKKASYFPMENRSVAYAHSSIGHEGTARYLFRYSSQKSIWIRQYAIGSDGKPLHCQCRRCVGRKV